MHHENWRKISKTESVIIIKKPIKNNHKNHRITDYLPTCKKLKHKMTTLNSFLPQASHFSLTNSISQSKKLYTQSITYSSQIPTNFINTKNLAPKKGFFLPLKALTEDKETIDTEKITDQNEEVSSLPTEMEETKIFTSVTTLDRALNASIVLGAGTLAITKLLSIDQEYWHGWTIYEILRYAPEHNWTAYEEALKSNPVLAKMVISGIVYSVGDWIAQCYEGKPIFEFDRTRMFRSGLVGFTLHGSLSHYYYQFCEALIPFKDWWVVPAKVAFDQTLWAALWNSIYFVALGFLRFESPFTIFGELKATFLPMLTAGWKLWPFAHVITYGVIPVEQRLLWVDCVELIWVTILSTYSNEKSESRISEVSEAANDSSPSKPSEE